MVTAEKRGRQGCSNSNTDVVPGRRHGVNDPIEDTARAELDRISAGAESATPTTAMAKTLPDHRAREEGAEVELFTSPRSSMPARRYGEREAIATGDIDKTGLTTTLQLTESEAWDRVAREVSFGFSHLHTNSPHRHSYAAPPSLAMGYYLRLTTVERNNNDILECTITTNSSAETAHVRDKEGETVESLDPQRN